MIDCILKAQPVHCAEFERKLWTRQNTVNLVGGDVDVAGADLAVSLAAD